MTTTLTPTAALAVFAPRVQAIKQAIEGETAREVPSFTHLLGYKADALALESEVEVYLDAQRDESGALDTGDYTYATPRENRDPQHVALRDLLTLSQWLHNDPAEAVNGSGVIPVGTYVSFSTKENWGNDTKFEEGTVTKVTEASYVITKRHGGTARLNRENAHRSNYSYSYGGRGLRVVRTEDEQRVWAAGEAERQAHAAAARAQRDAHNEALYAAHQAQREQAHLLTYARQIAAGDVLRAFAEEVEALALQHLQDLSQDAPGREESTLPVDPATQSA